ncbi:hypothetical protein GCM10009689_03700 [Brevibacterium antiquum]
MGNADPLSVDEVLGSQMIPASQRVGVRERDIDGFGRQALNAQPFGPGRTFGDQAVGDDDVDVGGQARELVLGQIHIDGAQGDPRARLPQLLQCRRHKVGQSAGQPGNPNFTGGIAEVVLPVRLHAGDC